MRIHYNNGQKDKIIDNVLSIQVVDANQPVTVLMATGKELTISLRNIEMILDETVFEKPKPRTNFDRIAESEETLAKMIVQMSLNGDFVPCFYAPDGTEFIMDKERAIQYTTEWLQKEIEE